MCVDTKGLLAACKNNYTLPVASMYWTLENNVTLVMQWQQWRNCAGKVAEEKENLRWHCTALYCNIKNIIKYIKYYTKCTKRTEKEHQ